MTTPNLYRTLGIRKDATDDAIRKAYRGKAKKLHPDHSPGDANAAARFQAVEDAYRILSDPARRAKYDATGEIDAPTMDKSIAELMSVLSPCMFGTIQSIVKQSGKVQSENVVEHMRTALKNAVVELEKQRKEAVKMVGEITLTIERFTMADGEENLLAGAARAYLAMAQGESKRLEAEKGKIERAAEYLQKCGYRFEQEIARLPQIGRLMWSTSTA